MTARSISKHIRPSDLVVQIRMERQVHKGVFLLIEGVTDAKRFKKFFDESVCSIINCYGKPNVLGAVELMQEAGQEDYLGFIDVDFDRILMIHVANDDVIESTHHDFDLDICSTDALGRYLDEVADPQKLASLGGAQKCIADLMVALRPLSSLRFANVRYGLGYSLDKVSLEAFFDGERIDVEGMIAHVSQGRFSSAAHRARLRGYVDQFSRTDVDIWQFTNGHDFVEGLGISLRSHLGNRSLPQTWRLEVERHLRLAFDVNDFRQAGILAKIEDWERRRDGISVIRQAVG